MADNKVKNIEIIYEDGQKKQLDEGVILSEVDHNGKCKTAGLGVSTKDLIAGCLNLLEGIKREGALGLALSIIFAKFVEDTEDAEE